jgi:hypothetical protein
MGYAVPPSVLTIVSRVDPRVNDTRRPPAITRPLHEGPADLQLRQSLPGRARVKASSGRLVTVVSVESCRWMTGGSS